MSYIKRGSRNNRIFQIILLFSTLIIAGLIIYIGKATREYKKIPPVNFDPRYLIRVHEISRVYSIKRDASLPGLIFFGCEEGLMCLREKDLTWKRYGLEHGLPSESIHSLVFHLGNLFLGTDKGLAVFDPVSDRFIQIDSTKTLKILSMESIGSSGLVFYADGKGLFVLSDTKSGFKPMAFSDYPITKPVTCLKNIGNRLYICQEGLGVVAFDLERKIIKPYILNNPVSKRTQFMDLMEHNGSLWVATSDEGVYVKDINSDTLKENENFPCKGAYVFADEKDGFWCGTPWGLWRYYDKGGAWMQFIHPEEKKHTDFQVFSLLNTEPYLWYGSKELGAGYLTKNHISWQPLHAGLSRPNVATILSEDSILITGYGYQGGFLDMFNSGSLDYNMFIAPDSGSADPNIQSLALIGTRIYYGGFESFGFFDRKTKEVRYYGRASSLPSVDIAEIIPFDSGRILCAGLFGIIEYDPKKDLFTTFKSTGKYRVTCILRVGDSIYYGTLSSGVRIYNLANGLETGIVSIPSESRVMGLAMIKTNGAKEIFAATQNKGCYILDLVTGKSTNVAVTGSLLTPSDQRADDIMAMRKIDNEIWLGTRNNGCLIFNPDKYVWSSFSYYDGLLSDQIRSFYDNDKYIWIGCYGGFNRLEKNYYSTRKR